MRATRGARPASPSRPSWPRPPRRRSSCTRAPSRSSRGRHGARRPLNKVHVHGDGSGSCVLLMRSCLVVAQPVCLVEVAVHMMPQVGHVLRVHVHTARGGTCRIGRLAAFGLWGRPCMCTSLFKCRQDANSRYGGAGGAGVRGARAADGGRVAGLRRRHARGCVAPRQRPCGGAPQVPTMHTPCAALVSYAMPAGSHAQCQHCVGLQSVQRFTSRCTDISMHGC